MKRPPSPPFTAAEMEAIKNALTSAAEQLQEEAERDGDPALTLREILYAMDLPYSVIDWVVGDDL